MLLDRYRDLFRVPAIHATMLASIPGRLPIGIAGFAILLLVQNKSGSFVTAGVASALYVLGLATVAPLVGRAIDRAGPCPVLRLCALIYPAMLFALVALVNAQAHAFAIALCAYVAGAALPPVTICMRTLYPRVLTDPALLQTAYSVDSVIVESVFVIGPALAAMFLALGIPEGAVLIAALAAAVGTLWFNRTPVIRDLRSNNAWISSNDPVSISLIGRRPFLTALSEIWKIRSSERLTIAATSSPAA